MATLAAGAILILLIMKAAPGDPALTALGEEATPAAIAALRAQYGLDAPLPLQILHWLGGLLQGDLGRSLTVARDVPVAGLILERLPNTAFIGGMAMILAILASLAAGTMAALNRGRAGDIAATSIAVIGISMPDFWLSYLLILVLAFWTGWFPTYGFVSPAESLTEALRYGFLPAAAIAAPMAASFARLLRAALLEVLERDHVTAGRALGFSGRFVFLHYVLRNALVPYVTKVGMQIPYLLGGVVVVERIFGIPGIGSLMVDACFGRDYTLVQGCALLFVAVVLVANLAADIVCALLDPKRTR